MKIRTLLLCLLVASLSVGDTFNQIIFSENFDGYPVDQPLPKKGAWKMVQESEANNRFAHVRLDKENWFGSGKKNQVLQIKDQDGSGAVRLVAQVLPITGCDRVRLSFDVYEPVGELNGSLAVKVGKGTLDANKKETANGLKFESGRFRPRTAGTYQLDRKFHVDIWFNESTNPIKYSVNGMEWPLEPGTMAVWVDKTGVAGSVSSDREVAALTAISALRIETFSTPMQEIWLDNIEVAVPTDFKIEKKVP